MGRSERATSPWASWITQEGHDEASHQRILARVLGRVALDLEGTLERSP